MTQNGPNTHKPTVCKQRGQVLLAVLILLLLITMISVTGIQQATLQQDLSATFQTDVLLRQAASNRIEELISKLETDASAQQTSVHNTRGIRSFAYRIDNEPCVIDGFDFKFTRGQCGKVVAEAWLGGDDDQKGNVVVIKKQTQGYARIVLQGND